MMKLLVVLTSLLLTASCRDRDDRNESEPYSKSSETARDDFDHTRKTYSVHINDRLQKLDARIRELADRGTQKAREAADELRAERDRLAPKLDAIGEQAKDGWDRFEAEVSSTFDTLEKKLDAAFSD